MEYVVQFEPRYMGRNASQCMRTGEAASDCSTQIALFLPPDNMSGARVATPGAGANGGGGVGGVGVIGGPLGKPVVFTGTCTSVAYKPASALPTTWLQESQRWDAGLHSIVLKPGIGLALSLGPLIVPQDRRPCVCGGGGGGGVSSQVPHRMTANILVL